MIDADSGGDMSARTTSDPIVRPRVFVGRRGAQDALLLEDVVRALLADGVRGAVALNGAARTGKSTALAALGAAFPDEPRLVLNDDCDRTTPLTPKASELTILAATTPPPAEYVARLTLAPWNRDDCIEFLLAAHRERCASVMRRWLGDDELDGHPELCRVALERMACDETLPNPRAAIDRHVHELLGDGHEHEEVVDRCLRLLLTRDPEEIEMLSAELVALLGDDAKFVQLTGVMAGLAAQRLAPAIGKGSVEPDALLTMRPALLAPLRERLAGDARAWRRLWRWCVRHVGRERVVFAELCHALDPKMFALHVARQAGARTIESLDGANLNGAPWSGLVFTVLSVEDCNLRRADLRGARFGTLRASHARLVHAELSHATFGRLECFDADLTSAHLDHVTAPSASFYRARMRDANLDGARLENADFLGADLTRVVARDAKLARATFLHAIVAEVDFSGAELTGVELAGRDLQSCRFTGSDLRDASLFGSRFDGVEFGAANLDRADLHGAHLTSAAAGGASFSGANLQGARLAGIDAHDANFRDADLSHAIFHFGSTRSGLLFGAPALEGSRTGFYDRETLELAYKRPEDVRVANLCGADLRGADLRRTDFYLVDLRGAKLDPQDIAYVRKCGALLDPE